MDAKHPLGILAGLMAGRPEDRICREERNNLRSQLVYSAQEAGLVSPSAPASAAANAVINWLVGRCGMTNQEATFTETAEAIRLLTPTAEQPTAEATASLERRR